MKSIDIAVVMPLYNMEPYIERSLQSVFSQTFQPKEIVIVDDGSTDNSVEVVESLNCPLIRIVQQENAGVSAARNRGATEAQCEYVAFLDADDVWYPNHLEVTAHLIECYPQCGVFATLYNIRPFGGSEYTPTFSHPFPFDGEDGVLDNFFQIASGTYSPIHVDVLTVRKQVFQSIGGFPIGMPSAEDLFTIARLFTVCDFAYSKQSTATFEKRPPTARNHAQCHETRLYTKKSTSFLKSSHKRNMYIGM